MPEKKEKLDALLAEIERLKLENALLRRAAGIKVSQEDKQSVQITEDERQALLRKSI